MDLFRIASFPHENFYIFIFQSALIQNNNLKTAYSPRQRPKMQRFTAKPTSNIRKAIVCGSQSLISASTTITSLCLCIFFCNRFNSSDICNIAIKKYKSKWKNYAENLTNNFFWNSSVTYIFNILSAYFRLWWIF